MKIQVFSDLHLEYLPMEKNWEKEYNINADVLCLCGDIGDPLSKIYWSFIDYARKNAKYVLILTGNHEYWKYEKNHVEWELKNRCSKIPNVFYLQRDVFFYGGYAFLGCTLWSHIPKQYIEPFNKTYPDFKNIKSCNPYIFNKWHDEDKKWLQNALIECKKRELKSIVLTHYTPSFNISHQRKYKNNPSQYMFSSDLKSLFPSALMWLYGHTHSDQPKNIYKIKKYNTIFASNQQGYPQAVRFNFDRNLIIDVELTLKSTNIPIKDDADLSLKC